MKNSETKKELVFANQREAFGQALVDMGKTNDKIVVLDADLGGSTMGKMFETEIPERHFEVGIAEANMVSVSAGLALTGKIPFASSFAVFASGRVFDQIRQSVCIGNVNVKICGSSAGLSDFGDGATHQSVEDVAIMRSLPNMLVLSPSDANEAYRATIAAAEYEGPVYLRISRTDYPSLTDIDKPFVIGEPVVMREGSDVVIFATGYMVGLAVKAAESVKDKVSVKVVNVHTIKPLDPEKIASLAAGCKAVVTVEEHSVIGGLGSAVVEAMRSKPLPTEFIGINDVFGRSAHGYTDLLDYFGLTAEKIAETVLRMNSAAGGCLADMFSLKGKTALVSGAGGGIGSAIAKGLAFAGATVALCDINKEALLAVQKEIGSAAHVFELDMTKFDSFKDAVTEISKISGTIDILINCAGVNKREGLADVAEETYDRIMDINLKGAFFLSQAVAPYMKEQKSGAVINIGSHNTGAVLGGVSVYGASKSALMSLTRSMAVEWAKYNIRANCISPGHIKTELTVPTWEHPQRSKYLLDRIALGRPGAPEDIVGLTILLASDAASYITGEEIRIDGGCIAGGQPWPYDTSF